MSEPALRIAVFSDTHLGYAAKCRLQLDSGLNQRVADGYLAMKETVDQIIAADVDLVLHGGDLFHRSQPAVSDIVWARKQLVRLHKAGIPVIGNTGNHDATSSRGKTPATAAVNDPDRGIDFITESYRCLRPVEGLAIHMISHYGLAQAERLIPEPVDGVINILSSHGAAMVPGHEVFRCVDSPGEQPIGLDLLTDDRYVMSVLGHYHGMDEIMPSIWYAGSAIRRGFSDPEGGRGWLLLNLHPDGRIVVERKYIHQRAQHDLPVIDAAGLTGADVDERIRANLAGVDLHDAIVRQVVTNIPAATRRGIDQPALAKAAADTLMWMPTYRRPEPVLDDEDRAADDGDGASLTTASRVDLPTAYAGFVGDWLDHSGLPTDTKPVLVKEGARHLTAATVAATTEFEPPREADPDDDVRDTPDRQAVDNRGDTPDDPGLDLSWMDDLRSGAREPAPAPEDKDVA